jgi:ketosteroid isomerase-like protein
MRWTKNLFACGVAGAFCVLAGAGCASSSAFRLTADYPTERAQIAHLLRDIFDSAEAKDLVKLDSYHWYGSKFTKFGSDSSGRQDAAPARQGEHDGLTALSSLKMQASDLKIDVFGDVAIATFIADVSFKVGSNPVQKQERATMVFVKYQGNWKITHEHFSAFKPKP